MDEDIKRPLWLSSLYISGIRLLVRQLESLTVLYAKWIWCVCNFWISFKFRKETLKYILYKVIKQHKPIQFFIFCSCYAKAFDYQAVGLSSRWTLNLWASSHVPGNISLYHLRYSQYYFTNTCTYYISNLFWGAKLGMLPVQSIYVRNSY